MRIYLTIFLCAFAHQVFALQNNDAYITLSTIDSLANETSYKDAYELASTLLRKTPETDASYSLILSKKYYYQAFLYEEKGDYTKAIDLNRNAQELLNRYESTPQYTYRIQIFSRLYHLLAYSGDWHAALKKGTEGLGYINEKVDKRVQADYIYDLGYINDRLNNYTDAVELYQQSIMLYKSFEAEMNADLGLAYNNLATVYGKIGFFSERLNSFEQAQYYWEKDKVTKSDIRNSWLIALYGNMMKLYIEYGDVNKASQLFKALTQVPTKELKTTDVFNKLRLNIMYFSFTNQLNRIESQLEKLRTLFSGLTEAGKALNSHFYLAALLHISDYYYQNNLHDKALEISTQAEKTAIAFKQDYYEMRSYTEQSKLATANKEYTKAITLLDKALAKNDQQAIGLVNVVNILIKKSNLQLKLHHHSQALTTLEKAMSVLVGKAITKPQEINLKVFEHQHSSYFVKAIKDAAAVYREMYNQTQNNETAQNAKYLFEMAAKVFNLYYQNGEYNASLDSLNKEINEGIYEMYTALNLPLNPKILANIEANNSQVLRNEFRRKFLQFLSTDRSLLTQRNLLQLQLNKSKDTTKGLHRKLASLDSVIAIKDPRYQSIYNEKINLQNIQNHLGKDELLINYSVGKQRVYATVISQNNIGLYRLAETSSLKRKLNAFYKTLQNPQRKFIPQAKELYGQLVAPFQKELKNFKNLTIVPNDFLHYLPFEVLENEKSALVSTHHIRYSNSLAMWYFLRNNLHQPKQHQETLVAFAPDYDIPKDTIPIGNNRFKDIQGARIEAEKISATLKGDLFLNKEATVENFINHSSAYKIYHLAMHAVLNEEDHNKSRLIFHNNESFDFSTLYEMYFPADLVVLSACNTGVGKLAEGEGLLSLSRALTYSGVRSSVYSLWEVPDTETSEIMVSFYNYLQEGQDKAASLAKAKKDFIANNPLKSHPYYWAGFVVNGDISPIDVTNNDWLWYGITGSIVIGGLFFLRRFRKQVSIQ